MVQVEYVGGLDKDGGRGNYDRTKEEISGAMT